MNEVQLKRCITTDLLYICIGEEKTCDFMHVSEQRIVLSKVSVVIHSCTY